MEKMCSLNGNDVLMAGGETSARLRIEAKFGCDAGWPKRAGDVVRW
jgi:hypothetical protein